MKPEYCFDYQEAKPNRFSGQINEEQVIVLCENIIKKSFPKSNIEICSKENEYRKYEEFQIVLHKNEDPQLLADKFLELHNQIHNQIYNEIKDKNFEYRINIIGK